MGTQVLLKDKINNKILGKTLIKLGLKKYNPNVSEEFFYFKVYKRQGIVIEIGSQPETIDLPPELISDYILKNSIKIQSKNSLYINGIPETFDFGISTIFNPENNYCDKDEIVDSIEKMLLEYKIIDEINKIYRNAYNKKNNVSSLSYIMETDENIDLINKIDIENLE